MSKPTFIYTYSKNIASNYLKNNSSIAINHIVKQVPLIDNPLYLKVIDVNGNEHIIKAIDFYERAEVFEARE